MPTFLFHKPFNVLSHFTGDAGQVTLRSFVQQPGIYAAGRLDKDSEGLLILTDDGWLIHKIADPRYKLPKTYFVQIEGVANDQNLNSLRHGIFLKDHKTQPAVVKIIEPPPVVPRIVRNYHPTSWLMIQIVEGKNRQVRRMTAAVGYPTLRLIRYAIGQISIDGLAPGEMRIANDSEIKLLYQPNPKF
jgi:23S rRNA pseudouridine2457 synthase